LILFESNNIADFVLDFASASELLYDLTMASIHKKRLRGHLYYYARECKRVEGKPKIVWQKYLGRLEDIVACVEKCRRPTDLPQPLPGGEVTELGASAALYDLSRRLGLAAVIDAHVPKRGRGPSVGAYLEIGVINRCVAPGSKAAIAAWFDTTVLRRLCPVQSRQLSSQRFWDNMHRVSDTAIAAIEEDLARRLVAEFHLDVSNLLFDGTNFFTFIDSFNDKPELAQRGKSKEGRASLRVVGVALLVTADFHVPLLHHTYPGNQPDSKTFRALADSMTTRCRQLLEGVERITVVFDKGNNSQDNLDRVEDSPYHFVGSLVPTQHPDMLALPRDRFHSLAPEGLAGVSAYRTRKTVFGVERTVLVTYNESLFVAQSRTLLREIAKRQAKFQDLAARLEARRTGQVRGGKPSTVPGLEKTIKGWLKARHMKDLFEFTLVQRDHSPELTYRFKQEAWENLQTTLLGKTLLFTDNDGWSDTQIVRAYRGQHQVESAFRVMKDVRIIAIRPQFHWTDQKIRVHVFMCVLALMLLSLLNRELHLKGFDLSIRRMVQLLGAIREIAMLFPPRRPGGEPLVRTSLSRMTALQSKIYAALTLSRYTSL
jgi:transposase